MVFDKKCSNFKHEFAFTGKKNYRRRPCVPNWRHYTKKKHFNDTGFFKSLDVISEYNFHDLVKCLEPKYEMASMMYPKIAKNFNFS